MEISIENIKEHLKSSYRNMFSTTRLIPDNVAGMRTQSFVCPGAYFALAQDLSRSPLMGPQLVPVEVRLLGDVFARNSSRSDDPIQTKYVILSGDAGMGKTTQISKLLLDWCESLDQLSHFDLIIYITAPRIKPQDRSLSKLLCGRTKLLPYELKTEVDKVLEFYQASDRLMFIIDDFCCLPNSFFCDLVQGVTFPNATILLSGRPGAIKGYTTSRSPDVVLDLLGLPEDQVNLFLLKILNNEDEKLQQLHQVCRDHLFDTTLLRRPLFAVLLCSAFYAVNEMKLEICQHTYPLTTTELFHVMLRASIKLYLQNKYPNQDINVSFQRSPLLDEKCKVPGEIKRLIYHLGKLSFEALLKGETCFNQEQFHRAYIDMDEINGLGLLNLLWDKQGLSSNSGDKTYEFCHKMFQEYFAALYLSAEPDVFAKVIRNKLVKFSNQRKSDEGYETTSSIDELDIGKEPPKSKFSFFEHCRPQIKKKKVPVEHSDIAVSHSVRGDDSNSPSVLSSSIENHEINLYFEGDTSVSDVKACPDHTHYLFPTPTMCSLVEVVYPFGQVVLFASGMCPSFTEMLLKTCWGKVALKVCRHNDYKYDVGYEALLFCEVNDESVRSLFYTYLLSLEGKRESTIQFPSSFDEIATVRLVASFSKEQARHLLKHWYNVDLTNEVYSGANIVTFSKTSVELNDPCLVQVLLMHKFQHFAVEHVTVFGNYFPDFLHLLASFPNIKTLTLEDTNIPVMQSTGSANLSLDKLNGYVDSVPWSASKLVSVHVSGVSLSPYVWHQLLSLLNSSLSTITKLHVEKSFFSQPQLAEQAFEIIQKLRRIEVLKLIRVGLTPSNLSILSDCKETSKGFDYLHHLDLSGNALGRHVANFLVRMHGKARRLKTLVIEDCSLTSDDIPDISSAVSQYSCLKSFSISQNSLGEGITLLLKVLGSCIGTSLQCLSMAECNIWPDDFKTVSSLLHTFGTLQILDISINSLDCAAQDFIKALPKAVRELRAADCKLQPSDVASVVSVLKVLPLEFLDLSRNKLAGSANDCVKALKHRNTIKVLKLVGCELSPINMKKCSSSLGKLENLTEVHLGENTCFDLQTADCRSDVAKCLVKCRNLSVVNIELMNGLRFSTKDVDLLKRKFGNNLFV